ncbi:MAG TPA: zinc-binding dehydrogenase, partial [Candidatus Limnocylindria bacterium]|nr:zinc-binding dehydrogenase [Candidatus Limnocylindria bacterium]
AGTRVVLDPLLGCTVRGITPPCEWCAAGQPGLCLRTAEGGFAPGPMIGFCSDLPGGWADEMVAHRSQLHVVPEGLTDETAVMVEPLAVALHGVLAGPPADDARVLVIGGGTLGLCTLAALRLAAPAADVFVLARHPAQRRLAERLGATAVVTAAVQAAVERAGARRYRSLVGEDVLTGGFDQVYDAVGSTRSLDAAVRVTAPRGRLVLIGGPGHLAGLDWTLVWTRELRVAGTYVYGREAGVDGEPHTMDLAMRLLVTRPDLSLGELVTHRFRLDEWRSAMAAALDRRRSGAVKIAFAPAG